MIHGEDGLAIEPAMESAAVGGMTGGAASPLAALRRMVQSRAAAKEPLERCELCGKGIPREHPHLLEIANRKAVCACEACAILFSDQRAARYRRIPRDIVLLADMVMSDAQWAELNVPINLAFFCHVTAGAGEGAGRVAAFYPSPGGATESHVPDIAWEALANQHPRLKSLQPDVEALLVNRLLPPHLYCITPIDVCFHLVGIVRTKWRGLSGGKEVWKEVGEFFERLRGRTRGKRGVHHG